MFFSRAGSGTWHLWARPRSKAIRLWCLPLPLAGLALQAKTSSGRSPFVGCDSRAASTRQQSVLAWPPTCFKVCVSDLDGTLLNSHGRLSDVTTDVLLRVFAAEQQAAVFVFATGRPRYMVPYEQLRDCPCFIVSTGGAQISQWHPPHDSEPGRIEEILSHRSKPSELRVLLALAGPDDCDGFDYTVDGERYEVVCHRPSCHDLMRQAFSTSFNAAKVDIVQEMGQVALRRGTLDFNIITADPGRWIAKARRNLPPEMSDGCRAVTFLDWSPLPLVSVQFSGCNKAVALEHICNNLAVSVNDCIAFGDSVNDSEMLCAVGCGVAVSNAKQQIKSVANIVLPLSNDEDAVAHAIWQLHENSQL